MFDFYGGGIWEIVREAADNPVENQGSEIASSDSFTGGRPGRHVYALGWPRQYGTRPQIVFRRCGSSRPLCEI